MLSNFNFYHVKTLKLPPASTLPPKVDIALNLDFIFLTDETRVVRRCGLIVNEVRGFMLLTLPNVQMSTLLKYYYAINWIRGR